jgi:hypothetical protein
VLAAVGGVLFWCLGPDRKDGGSPFVWRAPPFRRRASVASLAGRSGVELGDGGGADSGRNPPAATVETPPDLEPSWVLEVVLIHGEIRQPR